MQSFNFFWTHMTCEMQKIRVFESILLIQLIRAFYGILSTVSSITQIFFSRYDFFSSSVCYKIKNEWWWYFTRFFVLLHFCFARLKHFFYNENQFVLPSLKVVHTLIFFFWLYQGIHALSKMCEMFEALI